MRLMNAIHIDITFQFRHGFYYVYLFISVLYLLLLFNLQQNLRETITLLLLFIDTTMLGFFFIGAIVLLEKGQNILESLFVTPLRLYEYIIAKVISLSILAMASALIIVTAIHRAIINFPVFFFGLWLSVVFFTLFGLIIAARAQNVNDYFAKALGLGLVASLPLAQYLHAFSTPFFYVLPTKATLILLEAAVKPTDLPHIVYAFICLLGWNCLAGVIAYRSFYKHVLLKTGAL